MTSTEFQDIFTGIQAAIVDLIKSVVPEETRVYSRDVFDENESVWIGRLKDKSPDKPRVHCWTVTYVGNTDEEEEAISAATFYPTFKIEGFHYYEFGTNDDNSSKRFTDEINAIRFAFMNNLTLGQDWVAEHKGFKEQLILAKLDNQSVHMSRTLLKVQLEPLPFIYN
jgi:hypothetical protein